MLVCIWVLMCLLRGLLVPLISLPGSFGVLWFIVEILLFVAGGLGCWKALLCIRTSGFVLILFSPFPFLSCDPCLTPGESGVLVDPEKIDENFRKAWLPYFCRGDKGAADLDAFRKSAEDLTPFWMR